MNDLADLIDSDLLPQLLQDFKAKASTCTKSQTGDAK